MYKEVVNTCRLHPGPLDASRRVSYKVHDARNKLEPRIKKQLPQHNFLTGVFMKLRVFFI